MTWDILIRPGTVIDGCGSPGTVSDIALATGRICNDRPRARSCSSLQIAVPLMKLSTEP